MTTRLTTLSLLLLALYKVIDSEEISCENINKFQLYDEYLINKYSKDQTKKIRLKLVKDDNEAFNSLFDDEKNVKSNVTVNYEYFYDRILQQEISVDDLYEGIRRLLIVEIMLKKGEDDPQLIFESLNSTGLDLTEADKVRNYILMGENSENQEKLYKNYWYKIEKNTNYDVSSFLRDYLILKERRIPKKSEVYRTFKEFVKQNYEENEIENILQELLRFSQYYQQIINSQSKNKEISQILKRLTKLESLVIYPFLLDVYDKIYENIISQNDFIQILSIIESYIFRRFICNLPTNALNKIFMLLSKEIEQHKTYKEDYLAIFKFILLHKKGNQKFPNNTEFCQNLLIKDVYNTQSKNKLYLLERLENFDNRESDIGNLIDDGILTIEHIMPQNLNLAWHKELGDNYEEIHDKYLHTLGNITLTGYNSSYSNKSFLEKKTMEKGFNESPLYLNSYLKNISTWKEENILQRAELLKEKALKIWVFPKTDYQKTYDDDKIFTLADDKDFTREEIVEYEFEGKKYVVDNWTVFYENIVKILFEKDPILMFSFFQDEYLSTKLKPDNTDYSGYFPKISEGLYLKVNNSTKSKILALREMFDKYRIDLDGLIIIIK